MRFKGEYMVKDENMKYNKYNLIDEQGYVNSILRIYKQSLNAFFVLSNVISWDNDKQPIEEQFVADVYFKWDACTHWNFYGEDYPTDKDSYYHLCGLGGIISHTNAMIFATECIRQHYTDLDNDYIISEEYGNFDKNLSKNSFYEGLIITKELISSEVMEQEVAQFNVKIR